MKKGNLGLEERIETKAMIIGFFINLIMGAAGWYMFITTDVDALFLDANFSLISAASCLVAVFITRYSNTKTESFPHGMNFLEPLYGLIKSAFSIGLIVMAGVSAIEKLYMYFRYDKGEMLRTGHIVIYSFSMIILCFGLSFIFRKFNGKINENSIMLKVESKASMVDGTISLGVGIAMVLVSLLPKSGNYLFVQYTADSIITLLLILGTWKEPATAFADSFVELTHGIARSAEIRNTVKEIVTKIDDATTKIDIEDVKVYKVGKRLTVVAKVDENASRCTLEDLGQFRTQLKAQLDKKYSRVNIEIVIG